MTKRENPRRREREFNKFKEKSNKSRDWFPIPEQIIKDSKKI